MWSLYDWVMRRAKNKQEKEKRPQVIIKNIIKPMKVGKNERIIFVVGDEKSTPPKDVFDEIIKEVDRIKGGDISEVIIPAVIRIYIVPKDCEIELYRGDKLKEELSRKKYIKGGR